jgi:hypothetical protein
MHRSKYLAISATAAAGLFLAACSTSLSLPATEVQELIRENIAIQFEESIDDVAEVSCPGALDGVVGTTMTCTTIAQEPVDITVTVTSVVDDQIFFSIG